MAKQPIFGKDPEKISRLLSIGEDEQDLGEVQEDVVDSPVSSDSIISKDQVIERLHTKIEGYRIIKVLGEGGMGIVYLAEQQYPVQRLVALKIIKPGMDSKRVIARFEAEQQALARLDHPNIAHVYGGGTTELDRPYFVMEYIEGIPITDYCDQQKLTIKNRLNLFVQVCHAVQHAHQKGIIHRDIKPSNILVSVENDHAIPKIIDFGVAKATGKSLTEHTIQTEDSQLLGTPEYMSPEQADMATEDIDTRSDVYSLGVLLYVMLTGVLPFDSDTFRTGGLENIRQIICETDPKTPSTRLTRLGEDAKKVAENRRMEIASLAKCLQRELEWIPLKAMRKERSERYRSAYELAEDVENYLKGAALTAGPLSTIYRLKKIVRRNRALIAGIAAVVAVLITGTIVSTIFAIRAERQARTSQEINGFLVDDLLASVQEVGATKREITVESILDVASQSLDGRFEEEPLIEASLRNVIGDTYYKISNFEAAQLNKKRAIELRRECLGTNDLQTLQWMMWLGWYYMMNSKYNEAGPILEDTVDGMRRILSDVDWNLLEATSRLAWVYYEQGSLDKAEKLQAEALEAIQNKLGPEHAYAPNHMEGLAFVYWKQGDRKKALELNKKALEIYLRYPGKNLGETANVSRSLAWMYLELGRYSEAEGSYLRALELRRQMHGDKNRITLTSVGDLGTLYRKWEKYDKAQEYLSQELETHQRVFGDEDKGTLNSIIHIAELYRDQEKFEDAEQLLFKAEETARQVFGDDHEITNKSVNNLIDLYEAWNKPDEAQKRRAKLPQMEPVNQ